jgi:alkaline phosphatase
MKTTFGFLITGLMSAVAVLLAACASTPTVERSPLEFSTNEQLPQRAHHDESPRQWFEAGASVASERGAGKQNARNLILFVGDGMGPTTVAAARIFAGQAQGGKGEENLLSFERFPYTGYSKTYNVDLQTPDSAGTMTAMITGVKTRAGVIGIDSSALRGDCRGTAAAALPSLLHLAERQGMATGVVTTTRVTHATPASSYAHAVDRNWETDALMPREARDAGCHDIARQLIEFDEGDGIDVVMGGGRQMFLPSDVSDPEYPTVNGGRIDARDLTAEWQAAHPNGAYIWNAEQFNALDFASVDRVFGLFQPGHMQYAHDRPKDAAGEPSLAEMVRASITRLQREPKGYLLVVEAGRIDHAHHANNAFRALTDTVALSEAVQTAVDMSSAADTLIIVTADHSHVLNFAGYSVRGNPILGKVTDAHGTQDTDLLGLPYTTLAYANGPGYAGESDLQPEGPKRFFHEPKQSRQPSRGRPDLRDVDTTAPDYLQEAMLPLDSETHGGEDVGVYARGPGAEAVRGVMEQNVIFHLLGLSQPLLREHMDEAGPTGD